MPTIDLGRESFLTDGTSRNPNVSTAHSRYNTKEAASSDFGPGNLSALHLPPPPEVTIRNAEILIAAGEFSLGRTLLRRLLAQDSRHVGAIRLLGDSLRAEGYCEDAIKCYSELLRLFESGEVHFRLAATYCDVGQDDEARNHYLLGLECARRDFSANQLFGAYKDLGNISLRNGDHDEAEEYYNRAFVLNPRSDILLVNYGSLEIHRGQLNSAAERFRAAVEINGKNDQAWVGLALVHRQFGDQDLSWGNIERALELSPNNELALNLAVEWAFKDQQLNRVVPRVESYLQHHDQNSKWSLLLSKILFCLGRFQSADLELERFLTLQPDSEEGLKLKYQVHLAMNQTLGK